MNQRELAELRSLFRRSDVNNAITCKFELNQWRLENAGAVADASNGLKAVIQHPPIVVDYVANLEP